VPPHGRGRFASEPSGLLVLSSDVGATVLVTGSRGFTGVWVRQLFEHMGYRVVGLVQAEPTEKEVAGDLLDPPSLAIAVLEANPDYVIHLAGIAFVAHNDPLDMYRVNLFGTLNLLQAIYDSGKRPRKIIIASTSNVYGSNPGQIVGEDQPAAPVNHYGMSKLAMEHLSRVWLNRLPIVITRPFNYTGPGQSEQFLIPKIVQHFMRNEPKIRLGNLEVEREFNDVRSVAYFYLKLMEDAPPGTIVNLCSGVGHRLWDVLQMVEQMTGHTLEVVVDPSLVRANELRVLVGNPSFINQLVKDAPVLHLRDTLKSMLNVSHS
jgi:nucleoside-diphosphate-sugar epimerase